MSGSSAIEKARASATEKRLQAMGHPIRRLMLRVLRDRKAPTAPVELANELGVDLKLLSYHVRELVKYDLIEKVASEPVRGALKHYYVATDRHLIDTGEWGAFDENQKEGALIDFMQPIVDDFSDAVKDGILGEDGQWHITRTPIHAVDSQGLRNCSLPTWICTSASTRSTLQASSEWSAAPRPRSKCRRIRPASRSAVSSCLIGASFSTPDSRHYVDRAATPAPSTTATTADGPLDGYPDGHAGPLSGRQGTGTGRGKTSTASRRLRASCKRGLTYPTLRFST